MSLKHQEEASTWIITGAPYNSHLRDKAKRLRLVDGARIGATALALLMGLTALGVSANTMSVYEHTRTPWSEFLDLSLWPRDFNLKPTVALIVGSALVVLANTVSLVCSEVKTVRNRTQIHTPVTFAAPFVGFLAAIIAMAFYYVANVSDTSDTLLSWTCRWEDVAMTMKPHWGQLCKETKAGLYLSVLLMPVEAIVLALAAYQQVVERQASALARTLCGTPSPALS